MVARRVATAAMCLALVPLAGCSHPGGIPHGDALSAHLLGGEASFSKAKVGGRYGVAFPILKNRTSQPVTVTRVHLVTVPPGIRVIGYRAGKVGGPGSYYLSYEGTGRSDDYLQYPNLFRRPYTRIPPHTIQHIFFAADLRVLRLTRQMITGCQVIYETQGTTEQQTFDCEFSVYDP